MRRPLKAPYDGPYPVVKRQPKYLTLEINSHHKNVSVDYLKPAHLDTTPATTPLIPGETTKAVTPPDSTLSAQPTHTTHSGRHVHWPQRLASYVS